MHLHSQHVFPSALQPAGAGQHCSLYATHGSANASGMGHADRSPQEKAGSVHSKYSAAALTRTAHSHSTHTPQPPQIPRQQGRCAANASDEDCCCEQYAAAHTAHTQNLASRTLQNTSNCNNPTAHITLQHLHKNTRGPQLAKRPTSCSCSSTAQPKLLNCYPSSNPITHVSPLPQVQPGVLLADMTSQLRRLRT